MIEAQRIGVKNSAAANVSFAAKSGSLETPSTASFPVLESVVIDLAAFPFPEGIPFVPDIDLTGSTMSSPPPPPPPVTFRMNGQTAWYEVSGVIWSWSAAFVRVDPSSGRPPVAGFPAAVPLNMLPFKNWDGEIQTPSVLTCAPQSAPDVALVCNWAKDHGYQVRPRGVMHGWSPLTLPVNPGPSANVLLVDFTKRLCQTKFLPAGGGLPNRVQAGAGVTLLQLLEYLEAQPGGRGSAPGYSFPHTPGAANLTLGGMLAIGAHGTGVPTPPNDAFAASYGSLSNHVLSLTVACTDPSAPGQYVLKTFQRGDVDTKALLVQLGRTLIVEATLQVVDNYNLRCQSITDLPYTTIFAAPTATNPIPGNSFADYLRNNGRVEIIWFPFSENPWLHIWNVSPTKPASSIAVSGPYNYPFADHVPDALQQLLRFFGGPGELTPAFGRMAAQVTANGLDGKGALGAPNTYPVSRDIWGPSKNSLFYIQDTTLRVTANGYAIHLRKADVQQAVHDFTAKFQAMLMDYQGKRSYPVNSAVEIRVTALDDPAAVGVAAAQSPVLSALGMDATDKANGWDVAVWFDVLTIPGTPGANDFYHELERWLLGRFSGSAGRTMPEWSKGWAYTAAGGPWTDPEFLQHIRTTLTAGRDASNDWNYAVATLQKYDSFGLFGNAFLKQLFQPV